MHACFTEEGQSCGQNDTAIFVASVCLQSLTKDAAGQVTGVSAVLHLEGDFKKTKLKLTWLADVPELVPLKLMDYDYLITKKKVGTAVLLGLNYGFALSGFSSTAVSRGSAVLASRICAALSA